VSRELGKRNHFGYNRLVLDFVEQEALGWPVKDVWDFNYEVAGSGLSGQ
jgi:hypothetical protein